MKKLTSLLLAFAMLFSLAMPAMAAEGDTKTIYFDNTEGWETVYAYAWNNEYPDTDPTNAFPLGSWSGTAMTKVEGETSIYSIEVPIVAVNIIFNNGAHSQTADLTIPTDGKNLFTYDSSNTTTGEWSVYGEGGSANDTSKDVTANYDPTIEITDVKLTGDTVSYDADSDTYTVIVPAGETSVPVTIVASGQNLEYATSDGPNFVIFLGSQQPWDAFTKNEEDKTLSRNTNISAGLNGSIGYVNLADWSDFVYDMVYCYQAFTITNSTAEDANGTITVPAEAAEGSTVTVTVNPVDGYELDKLTVMNGQTEVEVSNNSFTMPYGAVTVTATFKEAAKTYNVTIDENIANGTVSVNPSTYTANETVTLSVNPAEGYELDKLTVTIDGTGEEVTVTDNSFSMPEANVTVTATFKKITYNVNIADGITGGTVSVDNATAAEGDTVTVTVVANAGYAYDVNSLTVTNDTTGEEITVDEASKTFVMPASDVTVTASFEKLSVTSANIVWGNMSFTYDDTIDENTNAEKGWTPAAEAGAGTVTVTNTGDTAFTAQVTYTAEDEYSEIEGTFDVASANLTAAASQIFTLSLNGKPTKAIPAGTKIGSVTIEIVNDSGSSDSGSSDEDESDVTIVTDEQGLRAALEQGGKIKLGDSITMASYVNINSSVTLDLNSQTLTTSGNGLCVNGGATLNISNGTISGKNTVRNCGGNVSIEGCTLTGEVNAFYNVSGTSSLKDCTVNGCVAAYVGTVTLYENITWGHGIAGEEFTGIIVDGGSVICHFDPNGHIDSGVVTPNDDGTWTVTAN